MAENNRQRHIKRPNREDFRREVEFDLALVNYWFSNNEKEHRLWRTMETVRANLLFKLGMQAPEDN